MSHIEEIGVDAFHEVVSQKKDSGLIADVREPIEFSAEKIKGSVNYPLSQIQSGKSIDGIGRSVYLVCKSGQRSKKAAGLLNLPEDTRVYIVNGGLDEWKKSGFPTVVKQINVWSLERQVRFTAGLIVLSGVLLSVALNPAWVWLSAFVGAGLVFAAVTNTCGMAMILAKMPWNRTG